MIVFGVVRFWFVLWLVMCSFGDFCFVSMTFIDLRRMKRLLIFIGSRWLRSLCSLFVSPKLYSKYFGVYGVDFGSLRIQMCRLWLIAAISFCYICLIAGVSRSL